MLNMSVLSSFQAAWHSSLSVCLSKCSFRSSTVSATVKRCTKSHSTTLSQLLQSIIDGRKYKCCLPLTQHTLQMSTKAHKRTQVKQTETPLGFIQTRNYETRTPAQWTRMFTFRFHLHQRTVPVVQHSSHWALPVDCPDRRHLFPCLLPLSPIPPAGVRLSVWHICISFRE